MFVIYENATKGDDPLVREFVFAGETKVRCPRRKTEVSVGNFCTEVKRGEKVYADAHPIRIHNHLSKKELAKQRKK